MAETTTSRWDPAPGEREGDVHWYDLPDDEAEEGFGLDAEPRADLGRRRWPGLVTGWARAIVAVGR
ncbi:MULTISPECIES: hypothetical protein [unclassified Nonomuraea]|uniref:hypothetical protein n=1 Tax=unclassified Nonomuraea TaxID=2593643 RepID=UPI0035BF2068